MSRLGIAVKVDFDDCGIAKQIDFADFDANDGDPRALFQVADQLLAASFCQ